MSPSLDLPTEILLQVGQYLNRRHILTCTLVCRSWSFIFRPLAWTYVSFKSTGPDYPMEVLCNKGSWIESLEFGNQKSITEYNSLGMKCRNLRSLTITAKNDYVLSKSQDYLVSFKDVVKHARKTLDSLFIHNIFFPDTNSKKGYISWSPLLSLASYPQSNLRTLKLQSCNLPYRHLRAFFEICGRLEILDLENVPFELPRSYKIKKTLDGRNYMFLPKASNPSSDHQLVTVEFPNLLEFTLINSGPQNPLRQLELMLRKAPKLRKLNWAMNWSYWYPKKRFLYLLSANPKYSPSTTSKTPCRYIPIEPCLSPSWPDLKSLSVSAKYTSLDFGPQEFEDILRSMKNATFVEIPRAVISTTMIDILLTLHSQTLTSIVIEKNWNGSSNHNIDEVFSSCPNLINVHLHGYHIQKFIESASTWICRDSLEVLSVEFDWSLTGYSPSRDGFSDEDIQDQSMAFFETIARFRNIKVLDLSPSQNRMATSNLRFSLKMGLSLLSGLTSLEVLKFYGTQDMCPQDIEWIVDHLVSLRKLYGGKLTPGKSRFIARSCPWDCALATMLNLKGIMTPDSAYSNLYKSQCGEVDWSSPVIELENPAPDAGTVGILDDWNILELDL